MVTKTKKETEGIACPRCTSEHVVRHGRSITIRYGKRQRFKCQECAHTFYDDTFVGDKQ